VSPSPTPTTAHTVRKTASALSGSDAILAEDLNAHFARYKGSSRDPYLPGLLPANGTPLGQRGSWALTGIDQINGVISAVIENSTSGDSLYLQKGDRWNGLIVLRIGDDAITFENALGQTTELSFDMPTDVETPGTSVSPSVPGLGAIRPLPALSPSSSIPPLPSTSTTPVRQVSSKINESSN
jgi:hypothetical protein